MKQRNIRRLAVVSMLVTLLSVFPITAKTQRLLKKYNEALWVNGYFIFTIGPAADAEEKVLSFLENKKNIGNEVERDE